MSIKAADKLKQMYLINHNKLKIFSKNLILAIFCITITVFFSACKATDGYINRLYQTINVIQLASNSEKDKNNELMWNWVIEAEQYKEIYFINNELIAAKDYNEKYIIINIEGNVVNNYKFSNISSFEEGFALVKNNGKCFFIDEKGEYVFGNKFDDADSFSNGFAAVSKDGFWGFIDTSGKEIIMPQFDQTRSFNENLVAVKKNKKWGVLDDSGELVADFEFENINDYHEGYCAVMKDGKWGFINRIGEISVDFQFDQIQNFSEGYAAVMKDGKWGFINSRGRICIALQYDSVGNFKEGKAAVKLIKHKDGMDEWAYIDKNNKVVIDFYPYDAAGDQLFCVGEFKDGFAFVSKTLISIIDDKGNNIFLGGNSKFFISTLNYNKEYDAIPAYIYFDDANKIRKYGLVGLNGNQRLKPIFDYISEVHEGGYVVVKKTINVKERAGVIKII